MSFKKAWLFIFSLVLACSVQVASAQNNTTCTNDGRCDDTYNVPPHLYDKGCNNLHVTIYNNTNYQFTLDSSAAQPGAIGYVGGGQTIAPTPSVTAFYVQGAPMTSGTDKDKVDMILAYSGQLNGQKTGAKFSIHLTKASCNASTTQCHVSEAPCCYTQTGNCQHKYCSPNHGANSCNVCDTCGTYSGCVECSYNCQTCSLWDPSWSTGCYCSYDYDHSYAKVSCDSANREGRTATSCTAGAVQSAAASLMQVTQTGSPYAVFLNNIQSTNAKFTCDDDSVCFYGQTNNKAAEVAVTINPSPIEQMTITFPFNPQLPASKSMFRSIYNNLNADGLKKLGLYYTYQPVVSRINNNQQTLVFSTLCDSVNCP